VLNCTKVANVVKLCLIYCSKATSIGCLGCEDNADRHGDKVPELQHTLIMHRFYYLKFNRSFTDS